jgi:hypothetical protein
MELTTDNESKPVDVYDLLPFAPLVPIVPVAGALVHFAARPQAWSRPARFALLGATALAVLNTVRWQLKRFSTPKPGYEVLKKMRGLELRQYPRLVVAETEVDEGFDAALDEGFARLASYLYGENASAKKLVMTAPVTSFSRKGRRVITFVMPPGRALAELPTPNDARVRLRELSPRVIAAMRFRGRYDETSVAWAEHELIRRVVDVGLKTSSAPIFAGYDAPATLPALRRNEVWVELEA